jgi:hypothetical protein
VDEAGHGEAWDDGMLVRAYEDAVHKYKLHHGHSAGSTPTRRPLVRVVGFTV